MTDRDSGFGASGVENSQNPETETGAEAVVDEEVKGGSGRAFPLITPSRATDAPPSESQPLPQPQPQSQSQLEPDSPVSPRHGGIRRRRRADIDSGDADADADAGIEEPEIVVSEEGHRVSRVTEATRRTSLEDPDEDDEVVV